MLRQALAACASWRASGRDLGVAVNFSPRSLLDPGFVGEVARLVASSGVPADALTLEITESSLVEDPDRSLRALLALRALGVRLSVDDLGTGYSSLSYLHRLPVAEVKIDRSFLQPGGSLVDPSAVVGGVVDLGHRLGYHVVAEGVEDEIDLAPPAGARLRHRAGLLDRPSASTPPAFDRWLADWRPAEVRALRAVV